MRKVTIVYAKAVGHADEAEVEIEVQSLEHVSRDEIVADQAAGRQLIGLFGSGYGDRHFTLVDGAMAFTGCRVMKMGAACTISYMRVGPYPPPESDRVPIPTTK